MATPAPVAPLLRAARPTLVVADTEEPALTAGLLELRIDDRSEGLSACEALVGNWGARDDGVGFLYLDRQLLDFGKDVAVRLQEETLFAGRITGLEGGYHDGAPPTLRVLAEDRLQDLRMTRRSRTFADVSDADVIRAVAAEHSLTADVDLPGPSHAVLTQVDESDLAFLRRRAHATAAQLRVEGSRLVVRRRAQGGGAPVELHYGANLRAFTVLADLAGQCSDLTVAGWDVAAKRAIRERSDAADLGAEIDGDLGGSAVLEAAFAPRPRVMARAVPLGAAEARATAKALYEQRARRFVVGNGVAAPTAGLRAGGAVRMTGLGELFDGDYTVTEVTHLFDGAQGLRTEFVVERPGLGRT